ncbi:outer membrane lipoprotein carrier protein LolA [Pseudoxanthomonas sp. F37]|uniref:outer membrane lipoprotein carrier protein LolA n=1 Tax=Pseudoxanthomonas TaxID=83618 RepID=UPI001FD28DEC|nr:MULTISPECIES: outer membrane lipoprotein carrier protein LolA [Pseudoxanthomonas]UOV05384.1 outer membrane lipoprotein carrier protein LolA [Pseudoxanthomonas mexicana]UOV10388.1 outer membrane lipoprotein carrier protein LolA [Pseudoxanthomonas sp. F37]
MKSIRDLLITLALAVAWAVPPAPAAAAEPLARVRAQVAQVPLLRGEFSQEKQVAGFRNPLRSSGRFLLARDKGVLWTTLVPFPSETVITQDRILSRQRDGSRRVEVDGRQQPGLRNVNAMMFALMSGDTKALTAAFEVKEEAADGKGWRMTLSPRSRQLAQAFTSVRLAGDRYVREVELREANGDVTRLHFKAMSEAPATLTRDEAARFD